MMINTYARCMKVYGSKRIQMKTGWNVRCAFSGSINRVSIHRLHTNKTVGRILTNFFWPYDFMERTTWEFVGLFCQDIISKSRRETIEATLKVLVWCSMAESLSFIYRTGFLNRPFCLKFLLRIIMALKFWSSIVEWILWKCFESKKNIHIFLTNRPSERSVRQFYSH